MDIENEAEAKDMGRTDGENELEEVREVVLRRNGSVLGPGTIVKLDQYVPLPLSGSQSRVVLSGAPNFRKVKGAALYGVGQPTVFGIRTVLNRIRKEDGNPLTPVVWINMREEPVIYINNRPFVLREIDHPMTNMATYSGVHWSNVQEMELRLKRDILEEAKKFDGNVLIHDEKDGHVVPCWEAIDTGAVQTARDVFESFASKGGYKVQYFRVPSTPEKPIKPKQFDSLLQVMEDIPVGAHVVYNCQMGRGRSTTGMIIAYLAHLKNGKLKLDADNITQSSIVRGEKEKGGKSSDYKAVGSLLQVLPNGKECKNIVDEIIERCGEIQNIRDEILEMRNKHDQGKFESSVALTRAAFYLERYCNIIAFTSYLIEKRATVTAFKDWMKTRTEIASIVQVIRKRPEEALKLITETKAELQLNTMNNFRKGSVLSQGMMLKADHVKLEDQVQTLPDAPNFQRLKEMNAYSVASPSAAGIRNIFRFISEVLTTDSNQVSILHENVWVNLREEPTIYVDGKPFVLRDSEHPFHNLKNYSGIAPDRLENMEERLKTEVLAELKRFGKILLHDEVGQRQITPFWCEVFEHSIQTPRELFQSLIDEQLLAKYVRIPITSGRTPEVLDFDSLFELLYSFGLDTHGIFNCQMGRGRSTIGLIVFYLIKMWRRKEVVQHSTKRKYEYKPIISVLRVLHQGQYRRQQVDAAIDLCGSKYNIREKIDSLRDRVETCRTEDEKKLHLNRMVERLERYYFLIVFNAYLSERITEKISSTFQQWLDGLPEIWTIHQDMKEHPENMFGTVQDPSKEKDVVSIIKSRNGDVMGYNSILKSDHFPGCQRMSLLPHLPGAPNFRKVEGLNLYGVAIPTMDGIKKVLQHLESGPSSSNKILWVNLREEPVIYVNNKPFVLRNYDNPFANLEYTGINTVRVQEMEVRLKHDILADAAKYDSKILLHDETPDGKMIEVFEEVTEETVLTPQEVYASLAAMGYPVSYERVAITDEQAPEEADIDQLLSKLQAVKLDEIGIIFNCQMGRGRTTTGMVIASLLSLLDDIDLALMDQDEEEEQLGKTPPKDGVMEKYLHGEYRVILRLIRVLKHGLANKKYCDMCIDLCYHMQNLRQDIASYRQKALTAPAEQREAALHRGRDYLKRYYVLIAFTAYLHDRKSTEKPFEHTFSTWMNLHPELYSILEDTGLE